MRQILEQSPLRQSDPIIYPIQLDRNQVASMIYRLIKADRQARRYLADLIAELDAKEGKHHE